MFKQLLSVALMFTLGVDKYEKGVVRSTAIAMGVVEQFSMVLGRRTRNMETVTLSKPNSGNHNATN